MDSSTALFSASDLGEKPNLSRVIVVLALQSMFAY